MAATTIKTLLSSTIRNMRSRPGHITSLSFFTGAMGFTLYSAPTLEDPFMRYACAGTAASVLCEVIMHCVDTVNMRSKIINGPKIYVFELIKHEGFFTLFRGIQPVFYGYFIAGLVYFYAYAHSKIILKAFLYPDQDSEATGSNLKQGLDTTLI